MADLERVKLLIEDGDPAYLAICEIIDAHLKEDAARDIEWSNRAVEEYERGYMTAKADSKAELARLHEENEELTGKVWEIESGEVYYKYKREFAELREAVKVFTSPRHRCDWRTCSCGALTSLRQLIEEKPLETMKQLHRDGVPLEEFEGLVP